VATRADYELVAKCLRNLSTGRSTDQLAKTDDGVVTWSRQDLLEDLVDRLVEEFGEENERFDENRFRMRSLGYVTK
jgi:hypothetical protein